MELVFVRAGEPVAIKIQNNNVFFSDQAMGFEKAYPIEYLKLNPAGIVKEFPDLKDLKEGEMKKEAIKRFKQKIKKMKTENEVKAYLIKEFTNMGYHLKYYKKDGFRPIKK